MRKPPLRVLLILLGFVGTLCADDEVRLKDGTARTGRVVGVDDISLRLALPGPLPGQGSGTASIPRDTVDRIIFAPDPTLAALRAKPGPGNIPAARVRWQALRSMLGIPESRAGEAGNLYGECLRLSGDRGRREEALGVYREIEEKAWNPADREIAKRGRLRTMVDLGRAGEIAAEIEALAAAARDPELLLDSRLLVAGTRLAALKQLVADNPRWAEDPPVRAERLRLAHETADHALYPFLFHGTARGPAARGLGIALDLHRFTGEDREAREVATDLVEIYPEAPEAAAAAAYLEKNSAKP